jgi:hypothetical protein
MGHFSTLLFLPIYKVRGISIRLSSINTKNNCVLLFVTSRINPNIIGSIPYYILINPDNNGPASAIPIPINKDVPSRIHVA